MIKDDEEEQMNYYIMMCNTKTFQEVLSINNIPGLNNRWRINESLENLETIDYTIGKAKKLFENIVKDDIVYIKVGVDNRTKADRFDGITNVEKLESGIYARCKVIEKDNKVTFIDNNGKLRVYLEVTDNLFNKIIQKVDAKNILDKKYDNYFNCNLTRQMGLALDSIIYK